MKGDLSIFIFIIVGVVLAGAILVIGMGGLTQTGGSIDDIFAVGEEVRAEAKPKDIKSICQNWLGSGAQMYDPHTIRSLGVAEAFKPYREFWDECGGPMQMLVTECSAGSEDCPTGILDREAESSNREFGHVRGDDIIECCNEACGIAVRIYDRCSGRTNSQSELVSCFNEEMEDTYRVC